MNIRMPGTDRRLLIEGPEPYGGYEARGHIKCIEFDCDFYYERWEFNFSLTLFGVRLFKVEHYVASDLDEYEGVYGGEAERYTDWDCGHKG